MRKLHNLLFIIAVLFCYMVTAQEGFVIKNNKKEFRLPFQLVNHLTIIPVTINGTKLSFLLDTGVENTILFSLGKEDSLRIENPSHVHFRGLGLEEPLKALKSTGNKIEIGEAVNKNSTLYILYEHEMDLSKRMGVEVHGIIGFDFYKQFVVEFKPNRKNLKVYMPKSYNYKSCKKCEDIPLRMIKNKPYLKISVQLEKYPEEEYNLLIDSGCSDALWVFQHTVKEKQLDNILYDHLGYTLSGSVYGFRSRVSLLKFENYEIEGAICSFPDAVFSIEKQQDKKDGILGAQILNRFNVVIDYPNKKIRLKPNNNFKDPFEYDMSGITLAHSGFSIVKNIPPRSNKKRVTNLLNNQIPHIIFSIEPQYTIVEVRENSPAYNAGLRAGFNLISVNGRRAHEYSLSELMGLLKSKEGRRIKFVVDNQGKEQKFIFELKKVI